ncbi:MAG: hypothetical protein JKX98_12215 [Alcanivoracaceae bacterium]|nr:hypothetical protein [Alcanivoracaceae bacterium]MBL4774303.1 hypothetical protein [Alcanivoracaceae bacterium]
MRPLKTEFLKFKNDPDLILDAIDLVKESLSASLNLQKCPYDAGLNQAQIAVNNTLTFNKKSAQAYALLARLDLNQHSDFVSANNNINKAINYPAFKFIYHDSSTVNNKFCLINIHLYIMKVSL